MSTRTRPTLVDVARIAGVSTATVSYVLSGPPQRAARISPATATRVHEAAASVGYVPHLPARALRLQRTGQILLLAGRLTSLFSQAIATSVEAALRPHGLSMLVHVGGDAEAIQRAVTVLDQHQADGLIIETSDEHMPQLREAATSGHAIVAIGPTHREPAFDVVSTDGAEAIRAGMTHVASIDRRHILLLSSLPDARRDSRIVVAHRHLIDRGVDPADISVRHCPHERIAAFHFASEWLPTAPRPVAVYAGSDVSAIGVLWACHRLGLDVPGDVAILGHGNAAETLITAPPLSSLGPTRRDFAQAADLIASRLHDRSTPGRHIVEPSELCLRGST